MNFTALTELENKIELRVEDYISRKHFFLDSGIIGWVFVKNNEKVSLYHLYLEEKETENNEIVNLEWEEDFEKEKENIKLEAHFQGVFEAFEEDLKNKFNITF